MKDQLKHHLEMGEQALEILRKLYELRQQMENMSKEEETEEKETDEDFDKKVILNELKKDFNSFFKWALSLESHEQLDCESATNKWKAIHPTLPIPRVCLCRQRGLEGHFTMLFLMDAYPLYLKSK